MQSLPEMIIWAGLACKKSFCLCLNLGETYLLIQSFGCDGRLEKFPVSLWD